MTALLRPIFPFQTGDSAEIADVRRDDGGIDFESHRRDAEVVLTHVQFERNQLVEAIKCGEGKWNDSV